MRETPLPQRIAELLELDTLGNPALFFDRGMSRDEGTKGWKGKLLEVFAAAFNRRAPKGYESFLTRRSEVLEHLKAETFDRTTQTRLVIGLGLPNPVETGFLFDRLTGCPYLPGSSVKGLLRATARFVRDGELEGDKDFWAANLERIFGPEIEPGKIVGKGKAIFYDAFPAAWPMLEVDVLTPHYKKYYGDKQEKEFPADWDNPNPVAFLAVRPGTTFRFAVQASEKDAEELEKLLDLGLDWLGIGAKKSAGYGVLGKQEKSSASRVATETQKVSVSPSVSLPSSTNSTMWKDSPLSLQKGNVVAWRGKQRAQCAHTLVAKELSEALKKGMKIKADVEVVRISGNEFRLAQVKAWKI